MRLSCPSCGAVHSLESLANDPKMRQAVAVILSIPKQVQAVVLNYVALFRNSEERNGKRPGLSWNKTTRLLTEVRDMVSAGHIQWDRRPSRRCPPAVWAEAMEKMVHFPPRELPLENHNYLRKVVYGMADQADRNAESAQIISERSGIKPARDNPDDAASIGEVIDRDWMKKIKKQNKDKYRQH